MRRLLRSLRTALVFLVALSLLPGLAHAQPEPDWVETVGAERAGRPAVLPHEEILEPEASRHKPRILQRLGNWLDSKFHYGQGDADFPRRHVGLGSPLEGTSWLNRPYHVDAFVGGLFGDELTDNGADQEGGVFSGVRVGWDFDHFWGFEGRFGHADPTVQNSSQRSAVQFFDFHVLYFPWGDAQWRPFFSVGSGIARYTFTIPAVAAANEVVYHLPLGVGVKYFFRKPVALRFGLTDNIAFGSNNLSTISNFSLTGSIEWHFGGKRRTYFPYRSSFRPW